MHVRKLLSLVFLLTMNSLFGQIKALYGGGVTYNDNDEVVDELRNAGYNTLIIWTVHILGDYTLSYNASWNIAANGEYIGDNERPNFRKNLQDFKEGDIQRIEMGLSAWQSSTYDNILRHYEEYGGFGPGTPLYENFKAVKEALPEIDAVNNDDEGTYDVESSIAFHAMLYDLGFKTGVVPYTRSSSYWRPFIDGLNAIRPGAVDYVYLQVYAGGAFNDPCSDSWDFGLPIIPGQWGSEDWETNSDAISPQAVEDRLADWQEACNIDGGFMWLYSDFDRTELTEQYASAIQNGVGRRLLSPFRAAAPVPANGAQNVSIESPLYWVLGGYDVDVTLYLSEDDIIDEADNVTPMSNSSYLPELTYGTTYYWRVDQENASGSTAGEVWSFTTEPIPDVPGSIEARYPGEDEELVKRTFQLSWDEASYAFTYDVYFGTTPDPALIETVEEPFFAVSDLEPLTTYYWKIVAENDLGSTESEVWSFTTKGVNLAAQASASASSYQVNDGFALEHINDGIYGDGSGEWASTTGSTPWIQLDWTEQVIIQGVGLYDRSDTQDNVLAGKVTLSDGTSITIGSLPADGTGYLLLFDTIATEFVRFQILGSQGDDLGLAELEVYGAEVLPGPPTGFSPEDSAINITPTGVLSWTGGRFTSSYELYLGENKEHTAADLVVTGLETTSYQFQSLEEGYWYHWKVDAINSNGKTEGEVRSFFVGDPDDFIATVQKQKIGVFPIPASDHITFRVNDHSVKASDLHIRIYDLSGHLIRTIEEPVNPSEYRWELDNREGMSVPQGVYMCEFIHGTAISRIKIIVN